MQSQKHRRRFTLIELLVVISIIAVLASLLLPALQQAKDKGRQITCLSNEKQLGIGLAMYVGESDGYFPGGITGRNLAYYAAAYQHVSINGRAPECPVFEATGMDIGRLPFLARGR